MFRRKNLLRTVCFSVPVGLQMMRDMVVDSEVPSWQIGMIIR